MNKERLYQNENSIFDSLYDLASKDKRVYALISDNGAIVYDKHRRDLSSQYLNLGISEANMHKIAKIICKNII